MEPKSFRLSNIQALLQDLIESAHQSWTYSIFWEASHSGNGSLLTFGDGYYEGEEDEGKGTNSSSSSLISTAEKEHRKRVLHEFNALILGPDASTDVAIDEEVTDREWFFFISMAQSFAKGSGLPGQAWQSSIPVWITGREKLESSYCERARQAQEYGLRTLVFIASENGAIELGSMGLNFQSLDLVNKAVLLLNFIHSWEMVRPVQTGDESESSNSIGNSPVVKSNSYLSDEELSLGLHLGFQAWRVKPENESKSSSSSVGNYPVPVAEVKEKTEFSGKLMLSGDNHSDSTDINAFVRILKRRR